MPRTKLSKEDQKTLNKLAELLKKYRLKAGYTSYEVFAYENDISRTQYGKYEAGVTNISLTMLIKILKALNVSLSDFSKELEK